MRARRTMVLLATIALGWLLRWIVETSRRKAQQGRALGGALDVGEDKRANKGARGGSQVQRFVASLQRAANVSEGEARLLFPKHFERHGHVVVVGRVESANLEGVKRIAGAFAASFVPKVDVVVCDTHGIEGELRKPGHEVVYCDPEAHNFEMQKAIVRKAVGRRFHGKNPNGDVVHDEEADHLATLAKSATFTVHVENGIHYAFDVLKVMFCSGNTTERMHFAEIDARNETVVDMFAGIGYFTVPLAVHGKPAIVHALELSPDSCTFLRLNALLNGCGNTVRVVPGDNRSAVGLDNACDRVLMGYIPTCAEFLPRAVKFLKRNSRGPCGVLHYHFLAGGSKAEAHRRVHADLVEWLGEDAVSSFSIAAIRQVKSYKPTQFHYVADVVFGALQK